MQNELIKAVRDYAATNYGKDGWDYVVECWSDEEIADAIGGSKTAKGAIAKVRAAIHPLSDMRDEVRAEIDVERHVPATVEVAAGPRTDWVAEILPAAAQGAITGKALATEGRNKGAAALAVMIVGFASDEVAAHKWSFDVAAGDGTVHHHVACTGTNEFGGTEGAWRYNGQGAISKAAQTAYKCGFQSSFFGLAESNAAVWTMASKAIETARAIRDEGMTATIVDGALKLEGGTSDKAKAMREAKSLAALGKIAKDETGTTREGHGNGKGEGAGDEGRLATPAEILALAARLCDGVAKGEEALSNSALSFARRIAAIVASNPDAFADA